MVIMLRIGQSAVWSSKSVMIGYEDPSTTERQWVIYNLFISSRLLKIQSVFMWKHRGLTKNCSDFSVTIKYTPSAGSKVYKCVVNHDIVQIVSISGASGKVGVSLSL